MRKVRETSAELELLREQVGPYVEKIRVLDHELYTKDDKIE